MATNPERAYIIFVDGEVDQITSTLTLATLHMEELATDFGCTPICFACSWAEQDEFIEQIKEVCYAQSRI